MDNIEPAKPKEKINISKVAHILKYISLEYILHLSNKLRMHNVGRSPNKCATLKQYN